MTESVEKQATRAEADPYKCDDEATHYFVNAFRDLKPNERITLLFSSVLSVALIVVGYLQYSVYTTQANIQSAQARPWVGLNSVLIDSIDVGKKLVLIARIKNSGGTPAKKTKICAASDTSNAAQMDEAGIKKMMKELEACRDEATFFLMPNTEVGMDVSREPVRMTQQVVNDVTSGQATFTVFGRITYKSDTDTQDHWTTFCAQYLRDTNSFNACKYGNDSD